LIAVPALAVGSALIVNVLEEVEFAHGLFPITLRVIVLLPAEISAALGV
jgi:hypothetical protein